MNKTYLLIAFISIGLIACGGSNNDSTKTENDSITEVVSVEEEVIEEVTPTFMSSDLKMFGLRGNVKRASNVKVIGSSDNYSYCRIYFVDRPLDFNKEGKWNNKEYHVFIDLKNKCDDNGFLASLYHRESDSTTFNNTYEDIDENGWAHKETYIEEGPIGYFKFVFTYEYTVIDDNGNWTERKTSVDALYDDHEMNSKYKKQGHWTETRKITYYE